MKARNMIKRIGSRAYVKWVTAGTERRRYNHKPILYIRIFKTYLSNGIPSNRAKALGDKRDYHLGWLSFKKVRRKYSQKEGYYKGIDDLPF